MILKLNRNVFFLLILCQFCVYGQNKKNAIISGNLYLDDSWKSVIYLSYIPTYDDMYTMSSDMIIAQADIDSLRYFEFDIDFLPSEKRLYRLHIVKKGDSPTTLIIGGKDENHMFFIADRSSKINILSSFAFPPFRNVEFEGSPENSYFQQVRNLVFEAENTCEESTAAKRAMIHKKLENDLLSIADTCQ